MRILTHAQLSRVAPAVFAQHPEQGVSRRYGFVPTLEVVEALQTQGWYPVRAQQSAVRDPARQDVAQHLIRFRQAPDQQIAVGDSVAELVLINSHDRSSAFQLDLGLYRWACQNALITPLDDQGTVRVRHARSARERIIERVLALSAQLPRLAERVEECASTLVAQRDAVQFAEAALALRYGEDWQRCSPIPATALLTPRRQEALSDALWSVFNRIHENLFKGGLAGTSVGGRRTRTRAIQRLSEDLRLNRALWTLTERFIQGGARHG
ncbi:MAG: DUF945 domain-containing protein [Chromatiaceae bacterium]|nr:DUF945 domain-containing protein [Chromatiaceae bacterium]